MPGDSIIKENALSKERLNNASKIKQTKKDIIVRNISEFL